MSAGSTTPRVVIIGAGITGLAAAHRLIEQAKHQDLKLEVLLLEAGPRLGGVIKTVERDGFLIEAGPDSFISEKPQALLLARRLGIENRLIETNEEHRRSFVVRNGKLLPVPEGFQLLALSSFWPFATSRIFSWSGKARMLLDLVMPRRSQANGDDDESLAQFVRRRMGHEALERMAQPMVGGIYTADPEKLSLRATMPRFLEMERQHRSLILALRRNRRKQTAKETSGTSGARYSLFLSFDGGMQVLVDELSARLPPEAIRLNTSVTSLSFDQATKQWSIQTHKGEAIRADAVCVALAAHAAAQLARNADAQLADELEAIPYASTATVNLAFRRAEVAHAMNGFGFVVPFIEGRTVLACSFSSVKFAGRAPADSVLLRAFVGGALQPEKFKLDDDAMIAAVLDDLRDLLGIERPPIFTIVSKWRDSMAQYHVGHIARVARIRERLKRNPTLQLAGNAFEGAGIPDCIRGGESAADKIMDELRLSAR
jgi:oxygen-dependent protoporphyrinogen oxidase